MEKITIADVASKAGVSKSTVSQFLNQRYEYMGTDTRKKIEEAIAALGYRPNALARGLKQKRTSTIGVIVANIMVHLSTEICRAIEDFFQEQDMNVILCNTDEDADKEKKYIEMLLAKQVDGIILFPTGNNGALYKKLIKQQFPLVFVDRKVEGLKVDTVVVNNRESVYEAVSHLHSQGHRRIAMIAPPLTISSRMERMEGYKQALKDLGLEGDPELGISAEIPNIRSRLELLFAKDRVPTAIIGANDLVLLEVLDFVKQRAIRVPEELALIVFDNIPFAHLSTPSLTTISQPSKDMGRKAAELLLQQIRTPGESEPKEHRFECRLIIRESSGRTSP
ncbi:substrate-binding domain-containing protein [Paenibacillus filicis]|uniref:Substrate-binding domain-containing protein n=1 Tax=Paenibacillus gyeongsangnamensis TaxID=3388067 RepID=A0ABT4QC61_9BACL|nr:substrate-binding domain-containing protein [Paenibacillus filicis]MCZ8514478.1 substrate-binding domain-containing protein [Paenibacillus filicis]